jgi:hypothetical protein
MVGALGMALCLLAGQPLLAQEDKKAESEGPVYPLFYLIKSKIDRTEMEAYGGAIAKIVAAHEAHENGNNWAAYTPLTGGPDPKFYYFLPMDKLGDMDGWLSNRKVVADVHGVEEASKVFMTIGEASESTDMVLMYSKSISNPSPEWKPGAPAYVYFGHVTVEPAKAEEYIALVQKLAAAHRKHEKGLHWAGYMNMIGGKGTQFFYFIGMDKLGAIDDWPEGKEVMVAAYGEEGASEIYNAMVHIAQGKSKILKFVPGFSRFEVPEE